MFGTIIAASSPTLFSPRISPDFRRTRKYTWRHGGRPVTARSLVRELRAVGDQQFSLLPTRCPAVIGRQMGSEAFPAGATAATTQQNLRNRKHTKGASTALWLSSPLWIEVVGCVGCQSLLFRSKRGKDIGRGKTQASNSHDWRRIRRQVTSRGRVSRNGSERMTLVGNCRYWAGASTKKLRFGKQTRDESAV